MSSLLSILHQRQITSLLYSEIEEYNETQCHLARHQITKMGHSTSFKKLSEQIKSTCYVPFLTGRDMRGDEMTRKCQPDNFCKHAGK